MSNEENGLPTKTKTISASSDKLNVAGGDDWNDSESTSQNTENFISNFSNIIVDGLLEVDNNNSEISKTSDSINANVNSSNLIAPVLVQEHSEIPLTITYTKSSQNNTNLIVNVTSYTSESSATGSCSANFIRQTLPQNNYFTVESSLSLQPQSPKNSFSSLEGTTSLESACSTVSFVTEIEIIPHKAVHTIAQKKNEQTTLEMEESAESSDKTTPDTASEAGEEGAAKPIENVSEEAEDQKGEEAGAMGEKGEDEEGAAAVEHDDDFGLEGSDDEDTTTLSSEAIVDDIELILMPEMCQDLPQTSVSPKLVRVTELKVNVDDVFCDDDEDQGSRHEFRSIVDEVCEEEQDAAAILGRVSVGDDDVSSSSEFIGITKGASTINRGGGECSSKSSSSSGRRRRSTSGRISSGVQTEITAVDEPSAISSHHGFRKKSSGKSSSARLGIPSSSSGGGGKKLNWKSELTLLPSKMKVNKGSFNSFESNDERDQYSPRVAKFTSQDTLNLSSQFLKPSTLYRTRNLSRNLNQFASSESTFMLPMSSEQQLSADSPRFRDRVSSSTSAGGAAGNFKGTTPLHSYSAYQISSILSGGGSGTVGGSGMCYGGGAFYGSGAAQMSSARRQPSISGYSGGCMNLSGIGSRHFRSSMPDLNAVNKSYAAAAATMADSHRRRPPQKSIKHHHSSSGFRLQKRSSSDEETSSLIDESERCLRSSIDLLLTDELPSPGDSCFMRSTAFGSSSFGNTGFYSTRRSCSQPILNDQAYPPEMRDPSMGSPFLPRKLSDMRCSRWAKVILPNGHVAVVAVKETDEIQDTLSVHTDSGCVINIPFRKVVFAWKTKR